MTRRSFRRIFYLISIIPLWIACAKTEGGDLDDNNGDGDASSGGSTSTGGTIIITPTGGAASTGGSPAATGEVPQQPGETAHWVAAP